MDLQGARVLITGGSLGIGKETARLLIEDGAKVAITGRHKDILDETAKAIGAFPIHADVAKPEDIEHTYTTFLNEFNRLDVLINNAGIGARVYVDEIDLEQMHQIFSVNVYGAALMGKKAAKIFKQQEYGHIVNIGSTAATKGFPGGSVYGASKFALRGMTQAWQAELRPYNVRVQLINPSEVKTAMGEPNRQEREEEPSKLRPREIAHSIKSALTMDDRGFIPELAVFATNPK